MAKKLCGPTRPLFIYFRHFHIVIQFETGPIPAPGSIEYRLKDKDSDR